MIPRIVTTQHAGYVHVVAQATRVDDRFLGELIEDSPIYRTDPIACCSKCERRR